MELVILFFILSTISYVLVKKSVGKITTTPIWLLWLSLMSPPFIWIVWYLNNSTQNNIPTGLVVLTLIISPILYLTLIEIGRPKSSPNSSEDESLATKGENIAPILMENQINLEKKSTTTPKPINQEEEKALKDCFPWGVYYLQKIDYLPQAVLCLGKLMTAPEKAYPTVKANLEKVFNDRFLIVFQETLQGQPFFALIPNPNSKSVRENKPVEKLNRPLIALSLLVLTFFTTTIIGAEMAGISPTELENTPALVLAGLPYSVCLIAILGIHELSHYLLAIYYKIKVTLPYFIPLPFFLGTFGAFISIKSPMPNRKAIFDVAIAGPLGGFLVAVPVFVWGLAFSQIVPLTDNPNMLSFSAFDPRFSLLLSILSKLALGDNLLSNSAIALHPAAIAGYIGIIVTALNLIPIGQLDGGHITHAMFGQGKALVIGQITRLLMIFLSFLRTEYLLWAIILLFMPVADQPALNDVTELDNKRDFFGLLALILFVCILLPLPPTLAQWLNI